MELVSRSVISTPTSIFGFPIPSFEGDHMFYLVTPDNPSEITINGVPAGTSQFTIGGYNRAGNLLQKMGIGNTLTPEFGYAGGPVNTDTPYMQGNKTPTATQVINSPKGVSDTQLINSLGAAANSVQPTPYFTLGNQNKNVKNANSNNFVFQVGSAAGIGSQVKNFNPGVYIPGKNTGVPTTSFVDVIINKASNAKTNVINSINSLFDKLKK